MPLVTHPHPSEVPHPKFTPPPPKTSFSQPMPNTSTSPMPTVPNTTHIHSNTNPQTHPQAYQPIPQQQMVWPFQPQYPYPQQNYPSPNYPPTNFPTAQYPPYSYNTQSYTSQPLCAPQFTYTSPTPLSVPFAQATGHTANRGSTDDREKISKNGEPRPGNEIRFP
jgi:hypothetical protein